MNENRTIYLASIYLFCATFFWAGNFIIGKAASINEIPPISLNLYRWLIAWFVLISACNLNFASAVLVVVVI